MALADIADVERIETDEWLDSRCLILSEITMIKIRAQWAGKVKYQMHIDKPSRLPTFE